MGFHKGSFVCFGSGIVEFVVVGLVLWVFFCCLVVFCFALVWFFGFGLFGVFFLDYVSGYNLTKGQMTIPGHIENFPVAAQLLQQLQPIIRGKIIFIQAFLGDVF